MEYTKEDFDKMVKEFVEMNNGGYDKFDDAYWNKIPWYIKKNKVVVVAYEYVNIYFGIAPIAGDPKFDKILKEYGASLAWLRIVHNGRPYGPFKCWSISTKRIESQLENKGEEE